MTTAIYARLSQDRSGLSENVTIQIAECRDYADERVWPIADVFKDNDISVSKYSKKPRKDYERLLAAIEAGRVTRILITEMPRLYRRLEELLYLIKMAERTPLEAIWTTDGEGYDLSTPEGIHRAIGAINNAMLESAKISKRVRRKKAARAKEGRTNGGRRTYGFEPDNETPRPEELAHLKEAGERWIAGEDLSAVIRDFHARQVLTTTGKQWRIQNLRRTLLSKRYLGIREHHGVDYPAVWDAIFTQAQHDLMQSLAEAKKWKVLEAREYLLTGFTYCECRTLMVGSAKEYKVGTLRRYRCRASNDTGTRVGCGRNIVLADPLEDWITEAVFFRFDSPQVATALAPTANQDQMAELLREFQERKAHLDGLAVDYGRKLLDKRAYGLARQAAEAELEQTKAQLSKLQDDRAVGLLPVDQTIREAWEGASFEWKQAVIRLIIERIDITPPSERRGKPLKGDEFDPELVSVTWRA